MKSYPASQIRNVAILGHSGSGKTSLAEAMLYDAKVTDRIGRSNDGNTVLDFDPEEIRRHISINTAMAAFAWKDCKINLIDTPGDFDFIGEVMSGVRVADASFIMVSGRSGMSVGAEKGIRYSRKQTIPFAFLINKMDDANADFAKTLTQLTAYVGDTVVPFSLPIREDGHLTGYVDVLAHQAYRFDKTGSVKTDLPAELEETLQNACDRITEAIAETDEALMEKYFSEEPFTDEEFNRGLKQVLHQGAIQPVFAVSATENLGVSCVLDYIAAHAPSPEDLAPQTAELGDGSLQELPCRADGPLAALVFKTLSDPFVGRISLFRVYSGTLKNGETLYNTQREKEERVNNLAVMIGKKSDSVAELAAGDIGAMTKLTATLTGDTLCRKEQPLKLEGIDFPVACFAMAILPENKGDEEKIMSGLNRLKDEDPTFTIENRPETRQMVISGLGALQIDVLRAKLASRFKVNSTLEEPRVPYRETVRKQVKVQGKHKKQSGGHGQYGDVWVVFEPGESEKLTFEVQIFGGSVPKAYHPAVEKGLLEAVEHGVLAGYPMVNLKATLVDGSYHDVDSSEMAFKLAAHLAYKNGIPLADPVLLEPIDLVKIFTPEQQLGDIMSDVNQKRGRIMGIEPKANMQMVTAEIPASEMSTYATDLRQITQGRGWYQTEFARYEQAPPPVADKVIAEAKRLAEEEKA
ncbi:MAG: elongation factor G [Oscillospiraceae bacterium]|nr:elongation factor G [Oscillospiraceae bacterium]MDD4369006.1 elongation factor G [Oscillospiraceae bacterium]